MKILLVESQPQVIKVLKAEFSQMGHQVAVASTADRALWRAKAYQFDALVVNCGTDGTDGTKLYRELLSLYALNSMPVLFLFNGNAPVDQELKKLTAQAEFIRLPFDQTEFEIRWKSLWTNKSIVSEKTEPEVQEPKVEKPIAGKVLLVEDNPINQRVLGMFIAKLDLEYDVAGDGQTAVDLCNKTQYSYVLMDIFMPGMDGIEATRLIRENEKQTSHHAQIIAISANESDESVKKCMEAGMDEYLVKPFTLELLKQKMQ
jgi:two-component system, sensor histidine kinase and response regulator